MNTRAFRHAPLLLSCLFLLLASLLLPGEASCHRVNVFAWVENGAVHVETGFSSGDKVKNGRLEVRDKASGAVLVTLSTDERGLASFALTEAMRNAPKGIELVLKAGEGHQNSWLLTPEELGAQEVQAPQGTPAVAAPDADTNAPAPGSTDGQEHGQAATLEMPAHVSISGSESVVLVTQKELADLVDRAVEARIAPLQRMLAEQAQSGPTLRDIVGGIGWILGLAGAAALARKRQ